MKTLLQILLVNIVLISCKSEKQKKIEIDIIGEWNYSKHINLNKTENQNIDEPPPLPFRNIGGFIFEKDGVLIDKSGYFDVKDYKSREDRKIIYYGDSTTYKFKNDSLLILNPINNSTENFKIISITKDTLTLQKNKGYYIKLYKTNYKSNLNETYDKIVISSSGCYGTCAIMDIEFNRSGDVYYWGEKYNLINGLYKSRINNSEFTKIENKFKKSNIKKLKTFYSENVTDLNTITVSFFKNGEIIKTVSDYASQAPAEFIMAYRTSMYLYQKLNLSKYNLVKGLSPGFSVEKGNKHIIMSQSEKFSLINQINNSKVVEKNINSIYKITFYSDDTLEINNVGFSDGRFFKINNKIYDLGYNFFSLNKLENRTEPFY